MRVDRVDVDVGVAGEDGGETSAVAEEEENEISCSVHHVPETA